MTNVDILITGSSRPQLIPFCVESIQRFITSQSNTIRYKWYLHEDVIYPELSQQTTDYAKSTGLFEKIVVTSPAKGLGLGMDIMLRNHITAPFMLYIQEDFEIDRTGIDMDRIIWTMGKHKEINYIVFNKRKNGKVVREFTPIECEFDGLKLTLWNACHFIPSLWRMSTCMKKWAVRQHRPEGYWVNQWGRQRDRNNADWLKENMGCYLYGGLGEYPYVLHLGNTWRMAEWRRIDGNPGGVLESEVMKFQGRAPWLPMEVRPTNKDIDYSDEKTRNHDTYKNIYERMSKEMKEELKR